MMDIKISNDKIELMRKMYIEDKKSCREIAEYVTMERHQVAKILKENKVSIRNKYEQSLINPSTFKKNHKTNVGKHHSEKTKKSISESNKGKHIGDNKKIFTPEESSKILQLYTMENKPIRYISKKLKIHRQTLRNFFKYNSVKIRPSATQRTLTKQKAWNKINFSNEDILSIIELYKTKDKSMKEIALKYNCSIIPINKILTEHKIKKKEKGYFHRIRKYEPPHKVKVDEKTREKIKILWNNNLSMVNIGKALNIPKGAVRRGLIILGISEQEISGRSKWLNRHYGENHFNWQNGKSFEPYSKEFTNLFKEAIRQREGYMCIKCGMRQEDSIILFRRKLHIHHINYDKKLTVQENCCAVCQRCNSEANFNRIHYTKFYQSILSERYGFNYSEDGKIIYEIQNEK